ncbi:hypothetical protein BH10PSE18_BH10PSE18_06490 [soil metagenome]
MKATPMPDTAQIERFEAPPESLQPPFVKTRYSGAVMICGECQKRDNGPSKLTAKDVRKDLKHALGDARHHLRLVQSSCLGLCPKKAIAVAAVAVGGPALLAEIHGEEDVATVAARLAAPTQR